MVAPLGRPEDAGSIRRTGGRVFRRVENASFCEVKGCTKLASWRIGYGSLDAELCPRHAVTSMRSRKLWVGSE